MARAPNEKVKKAKELYDKGYKLIDIAKKLNIPSSTVRRWKSTYKWDNERSDIKSERSEKNNKKKIKIKATCDEVKEVVENTELTDKQRLFCIYYMQDFNATRAYKKAYDCNYNTARVEGSKNLAKPNIKKEINRLTEECLQEKEVESKLLNKRLLEMYMKIAFADISDYLSFGQEKKKVFDMNDDGSFQPVLDPETGEQKIKIYNVVNLNESSEVDTSVISEVSEGKDGVKIKLQDKMKALDFLAKHYSYLSENEKVKLEIENKKLQNEKLRNEIKNQIGDTSSEGVQDFLQAVNPSEEDIKALFEGEEDGQE